MTNPNLFLIAVCIILPGLLNLSSARAVDNPGSRRARHGVEAIWVDTRMTFHQQTEAGEYDSHFQGDYFNFHVKGSIADNLSFRIRQRFNKGIDQANPFNATDFLYLRWQATPKWSFTAGKQAILIGGYEIDSAPIDVYYYGAFSNRLNQYYAFGASVGYSPVPGQEISFQFVPSPISPSTQNRYSYNIYWNGGFASWWRTIWSTNLVEDIYGRKMNWLVLGNKFTANNFFVDIDLINRASANQKQLLFSDFSFICKAIWTVGKWNLCTKVGYESNSAENVDSQGLSYDLVLPAGHDYLYGGAGVEFFPFGDERLRLHAVLFRDNHDRVNNFDIGMTWRFTIYEKRF